jgi:hypothetical protein
MDEPSVWEEPFDTNAPVATLGLDEPEEEGDISDAVTGLLFVGRLTKDVSVRGHTISLRTLLAGEELQVGLAIKQWADTPEEGRAYACAVVAAAVEAVDGKPLVASLGPNQEDLIQRKFRYVTSNWHYPVIAEIYKHYVALQREQAEALDEFSKK